MICATEFYIRFLTDKPVREEETSHKNDQERKATIDPRMKIMIYGLAFSTICLFIRYVHLVPKRPFHSNLFSAVYRTVELADGWSGRIISTQIYFSPSCYPLYHVPV